MRRANTVSHPRDAAPTRRVRGAELMVGDVLENFGAHGNDRITGLYPYVGPLADLFSAGAQIAGFALASVGMTIDNADVYTVRVPRPNINARRPPRPKRATAGPPPETPMITPIGNDEWDGCDECSSGCVEITDTRGAMHVPHAFCCGTCQADHRCDDECRAQARFVGCLGCGRNVAGKGEAHTAECRLARYEDALERGHAWSTADTEAVTDDEIASGNVDPECDRCGQHLSTINLNDDCDPQIAVPASTLRAVRDTWESGDLAGAVTDLLAFLDEHEATERTRSRSPEVAA